MAFTGGIGSLIRQSLYSNGLSKGKIPVMSIAVRYMSSSKLFIGGLSYGVDDQSLRDAFTSFGDVVEVYRPDAARVITDRDTGRSRGFGFVNFADDECASKALSGMDGQELNGRNIRVSYANDRPSGGFRGGGYGGGGYGGGYGGGGYGGGGGSYGDGATGTDDFGGGSSRGY